MEDKLQKIAFTILAGGNGERLGGTIKANIKVGDTSLFNLVANNIKEQEGLKLLSIGFHDKDQFSYNKDWTAINDISTNIRGPLAGLISAIDYIKDNNLKIDYILTLPVDNPFFPKDFSEKALKLFNENIDVIVASYEGQIYPTNALWRFSAISDLPSYLQQKENLGIRKLLDNYSMFEFKLDEFFDKNPCQNINTKQDLLNCSRRMDNSYKN